MLSCRSFRCLIKNGSWRSYVRDIYMFHKFRAWSHFRLQKGAGPLIISGIRWNVPALKQAQFVALLSCRFRQAALIGCMASQWLLISNNMKFRPPSSPNFFFFYISVSRRSKFNTIFYMRSSIYPFIMRCFSSTASLISIP
jgi:hypothetical protein